jgi:NDP-sugar pyrophosphorylase family protein
MIYILEPEIFDYFPDQHAVDFALEVFPALLEHDVPFHVHTIDSYWNDVGSLPEYIQGNLDVLEGAVAVEGAGALLDATGGGAAVETGEAGIDGPVLVDDGCRLDPAARLDGPLVIGEGSAIGAGARVKHSVLLPGSRVPEGAIVAGAVFGRSGGLT